MVQVGFLAVKSPQLFPRIGSGISNIWTTLQLTNKYTGRP
jgi:hypothetical protein